MLTFDYSSLPLGPKDIRILELLPSTWSTERVQARIFKAPLDNLPPYSALSYTWGNESIRVDIVVGGHRLSITASLETALRALRSADQSELLWIDQICINQHDGEEKSHQIKLMRKIYSLSAQTVGWLGESLEASDLAMKYLRDVGFKANAIGLASLEPSQMQALLADEADVASGMVVMDEPTAKMRRSLHSQIAEMGSLLTLPGIEGMIALCKLPYFQRGWIQQEVAIPPTLVLKWGNESIHANIFAAAIHFHIVYVVKSLPSLVTPSIMAMPAARALLERIGSARVTDYIQKSMVLRRFYHTPTIREKLSMANVLWRLRKVKFSQAQDKVYGILGLAADVDQLELDVDVERSWEDVFTHAARRIIDAHVTDEHSLGGINFLSLVSFPKSSSALPSWVPDLTRLDIIQTLAEATTSLATPYHASRGMTHSPVRDEQESFTLDEKFLRCRGVLVDIITEVGPPWEADASGQRQHEAGLSALSSISEFASISTAIAISDPTSKHPFRNQPQRLAEAEWRVPVLNRESVSSTGTSRHATTWSQRGHEMVKYTMAYSSNVHDIWKVLSNIAVTPQEEAQLRLLGREDRQLAEAKMKMEKADAYYGSPEHSTYTVLMDAFKERRSFLGAEGFLGIGPLGMRPGDVVCVLYGGSFPYVLRELPLKGHGHYALVGEAYCDGIMDGEALSMGMPSKIFTLL